MILVTGSAGHLGNVLVRELVARGEAVRALLLPGEDPTPLNDLAVERCEADILDYPALSDAFLGIDTVYHLAGMISILPGKNPLLGAVNVLGTRNVIHASLAYGVRRLIYTSSIHALRRIPHGVTVDESVPFDPEAAISAYDHSKAQASLEVLKAISLGLDAVIVCPTGVIGPYDFRLSEMGHIILGCLERKPQLYVDGAYDFVDVRDVAQGLILANQRGRQGETYILSGEQLTVRRLLDTIKWITGKQFLRVRIPFRLAQWAAHATPMYYRLTKTKPRFTPYSLETLASNSVISFDKSKRELGYSPRPLHESLADTIHWFRQNKPLLQA
jgi:dihydroflavonol-4-reductase